MVWAVPKTNPDQRGYGPAHRKARKAAALRHRPTDPCARCGKPLGPMGPHLHYDHTAARDGYLGFSHARCNIRAGAKAGQRKSVRAKVYLLDLTGNGCPTCGRMLTTTDKAAGRKYCSQRCGWLAHKNNPPKPKTPRVLKPKPTPQLTQRACATCGATYTGKRKYCSDDCMLEYNARAGRERYRAKVGLPPTWERSRWANRW